MTDPAAADEPTMPVDNIADALPLLRRPFSPGAVKWKVQSEWPKEGEADGAICVGYIDARLVSARLNKVVGGNWSEKPIRVEGATNALLCELTVFDQTHTDLGVAQGRTDEMKLKAVHSDALKRPAVRFGIGESIYAMPEIRIGVTGDGAEDSSGNPTIKRVARGKRQGRAGYLTEAVEAHLRSRYEDWLRTHGEGAFGKALDHGDAVEGSVGMGEAVDEAPADTPPADQPLTDEKALALAAQARELRDKVRLVDDGALPDSSFDAALGQREHSHDRLEDFVGNLTELLADVEKFADLVIIANDKLGEADAKKAIDKAKRRASRAERVDSLEKSIAEGAEAGGEGDA
jgi:hypothetical protein